MKVIRDRSMERNALGSLLFSMVIMQAYFTTINASLESDIICLKSIKESLEDPLNIFSSWVFKNDTHEGFFCEFHGVGCWHYNSIATIQLAGTRLRGPFPVGIKNCNGMTYLDLSRNYLSGPIPADVGDGLRFMVNLDLSNNNLSGPIPQSIVNWKYINFLRLDHNHLTGQIPPDFGGLGRIKVFNVANNRLSGFVPVIPGSNLSAESYANNLGLCGGPLKACKEDSHGDLFLSGFEVGFPLFTILNSMDQVFKWKILAGTMSRLKMKRNNAHGLRLWMLIMVACFATSKFVESEISCLKSIKESLEDPSGTLANWDFNNMHERSICSFTGVECSENKNIVIRIQLIGSRLRGPFPIGIRNCTNLKFLFLSINDLSGPIPFDLGDSLQSIEYLHLSNNSLSDLTKLDRIKVFSVANNRLSGHVPMFGTGIYFYAKSYANNTGLCGGPLNACKGDGVDDNFFLSVCGLCSSVCLRMYVNIDMDAKDRYAECLNLHAKTLILHVQCLNLHATMSRGLTSRLWMTQLEKNP
ncbi:hypothetical protein LXL04_035703 [Taraxacum kok-saghyz]